MFGFFNLKIEDFNRGYIQQREIVTEMMDYGIPFRKGNRTEVRDKSPFSTLIQFLGVKFYFSSS